MSLSTPTPAAPVLPQAPSPPPMFGQQGTPGQKPQGKSSQPTTLGAGLTSSQKGATLLGEAA